MRRTFEKQASNSLLRLHSALVRKVEPSRLQDESYRDCWLSVVFLYEVAIAPTVYCVPGKKFDESTEKLGILVFKRYNLFGLDEEVAQCVYDIMVCVRDYMFYSDENAYGIDEKKICKYKSKQEAFDAMCLLRDKSIMLTGGFVLNGVRSLCNFVFGSKNK